MPPIDDRTPSLSLALPNKDNKLSEDVERLREALTSVDTAVAARQATSQKGQANGYAGLDSSGRVPTAQMPTGVQYTSEKGAANGYASLDGSGKVPAVQLPSYVDDVAEFASVAAFPGSGESGKIYVAQDTNKTYRWSGSAYIEISPSPGTTDALVEGITNLYFTVARARAAQQLATASNAGLVKIGAGLSVAGDGTVSVDGAEVSFSDLTLTPSTNGQTTFSVAGGYTPGLVDVFLNGALLNPDDYTATNGTSFVLAQGATTTDTIKVRRWTPFAVANTVSKSGDTLTGTLFEPRSVVSGSDINLAQGTVFTRTISGATTFTVSGVPAAGVVAAFMLDLTNGGSAAVNWWPNIRWPAGLAPTLTFTGRDLLGFMTHDGGANWTGVMIARDVK